MADSCRICIACGDCLFLFVFKISTIVSIPFTGRKRDAILFIVDHLFCKSIVRSDFFLHSRHNQSTVVSFFPSRKISFFNLKMSDSDSDTPTSDSEEEEEKKEDDDDDDDEEDESSDSDEEKDKELGIVTAEETPPTPPPIAAKTEEKIRLADIELGIKDGEETDDSSSSSSSSDDDDEKKPSLSHKRPAPDIVLVDNDEPPIKRSKQSL